MKKITMFLSLFVLLSVFLVSCLSVYNNVVQTLPENVRKIYVKPFINTTTQFGLEAKFTSEVIEEIISDGRLSFVNTEADGDAILTVTIVRYVLQPLTYDVNMLPEQYKLWVVASVSLIDKYNNVPLWTELIEGIHIYKDIIKSRCNYNVDMFDGMTEEDAREILWQKISRNIVRRIVKAFNSVTSMSEKEVSA
ncbi:MAG: LPS assembly lipoprotein LptE [Endomicrobium sp.]|nr:LPS assembly lipoprotein LptE [Endomicrobium sp.]